MILHVVEDELRMNTWLVESWKEAGEAGRVVGGSRESSTRQPWKGGRVERRVVEAGRVVGGSREAGRAVGGSRERRTRRATRRGSDTTRRGSR